MQDRHKYSSTTGVAQLLGTAWNLAIADGLALISMAAFVVLLGRIYGTAALGQFSFAVAVTSIAQTLADAGFDITLPRSIRQHPLTAYDQTSRALRVKLVLSMCVLPLTLIAALWKDSTTLLVTLIMAVDIIPSTLSYGLSASLRGLQQSTIAARINALYNVIPILLCCALVFVATPLPFFALLILLGDVAKFIHLETTFNRHSTTALRLTTLVSQRGELFDGSLWRQCWAEQRGVTLTNLFSSALVRMPSVMLGWFAGNVQTGVYSAASRFFSALRIVPGAVLNTIIPQYAQRDASSPRIRIVLVLSVICALVIASSLYLAAPTLIHLTFRIEESISVLQILSLATAALFVKTTLEAFLLAAHRENIVNAVLAVVSCAAIIAYFISASVSVNAVAIVVCCAECACCITFAAIFLMMRVNTHRRARVI